MARFHSFVVHNGIVSLTINIVVTASFNGVAADLIGSIVVPFVN